MLGEREYTGVRSSFTVVCSQTAKLALDFFAFFCSCGVSSTLPQTDRMSFDNIGHGEQDTMETPQRQRERMCAGKAISLHFL